MLDDLPSPDTATAGTNAPGQVARPYAALFVVCLGLVIVSLDNSVLNIALPALSRDLGATTSDLQWIIDAYVLAYAGLMLTAGSLGDRFGRRRSMFWGTLLFGVSSGVAAFSDSSTMLIWCRGAMGVCGAFLTPASLSIITNLFHDPRERGRAIGIWAAVSTVGVAIGPVIGGVLLEHFWWGSVFFINVPFALCLVALLPMLVPESKDPNPGALDPLGAVLSIAAMSAVLWATISGPDHGWTSSPVLGAYAVAVIAGIGFVWWELHTPTPMIDMHFFTIPGFSAAGGANLGMVAAWAGTNFLFVQLLQSILGYSPYEAGIRLIPFAAIGAVGGLCSAPLAGRIGRKRLVICGLLLQMAGAILFLFYDASQGYWIAMAYLLIFNGGQSVVFSQCIASVMESVPREKSGVASGANSTLRQSAMAFGIAISGSIFSTTYRSELRDRATEAGFDGATIETAGRSVASAARLATDLGGDAGDRLFAITSDSFTSAMHIAMIMAIGFCAIGLAVAAIWLPGRERRAD
ncbi:MAG: MFS transporter [Acidimicrobiia bacterium]